MSIHASGVGSSHHQPFGALVPVKAVRRLAQPGRRQTRLRPARSARCRPWTAGVNIARLTAICNAAGSTASVAC